MFVQSPNKTLYIGNDSISNSFDLQSIENNDISNTDLTIIMSRKFGDDVTVCKGHTTTKILQLINYANNAGSIFKSITLTGIRDIFNTENTEKLQQICLAFNNNLKDSTEVLQYPQYLTKNS